jgi:hypothetical protein
MLTTSSVNYQLTDYLLTCHLTCCHVTCEGKSFVAKT